MFDQLPPQNESQEISSDPGSELEDLLSKSFEGKVTQEPAKSEAPQKTESDTPKEEPKQVVKDSEPSKVEAKPEVAKTTETEKPALSQAEIEKLNPTDKGAWGAIKNANKAAHKIIENHIAENTKLKAALAEKESNYKKEIETIKAEKADLEKYRAMVDIQADPDFVSTHDAPLEKARNSIKDLIKSLNVSQETVDKIEFNNPERMEEIIDLVAQNKDRFTASKIERKVREYLDLADKREETLKEHKEKYKETLENKKKESFAKGAENEGRMIKHVESIAPNVEFLKKKDPKENSTAAEIEQINQHNAMVDNMKSKLDIAMKNKEPEHVAELAIAAVSAHWFKAKFDAVNTENAKLKEELAKISAVNTETPSRKPAASSKNGKHEFQDSESAVTEFFSNRS